jgi:hypothetical protein
VTEPPIPPTKKVRRHAAQVGRWGLKEVVGALIALGVLAALAWLGVRIGDSRDPPTASGNVTEPAPSLDTQIDAIRAEMARGGRRTLATRTADLHGSGGASYLFVFRHARLDSHDFADPQSDELRIYDVVNDALTLRFSFQPRPLTFPDDEIGGGVPYLFRIEEIRDYDGDGTPEILGDFRQLAMTGVFPRPVFVVWDEGLQKYTIGSLTPEKPRVVRLRDAGTYAEALRALYTRRDVLRDTLSSVQVGAFPVEFYAVRRTRDPDFPILLNRSGKVAGSSL